MLIALMSLALFGCDGTSDEETTFPEEEVTLAIPGGSLSVPYISADSLNPFFCETLPNSALTSLTYRYLYTLDTSFTPVRDIAVSEALSENRLKVVINPDLVFSDGSALTAEDVAYSFECAKGSERYSAALKGIDSCKATDDRSVIFSLEYKDVHVTNVLTFPIVKKGTAGTKDMKPVGNGFYQFNEDGIRLTLKANLRYAGSLPSVGTVRLTDVSKNTAPANLVGTGELDFYYSDLAGSDITGVNCSAMGVYLNNLVFMGVNHSNVNMVLSSFRQALSYGIDRQSLAENAFMGYARAAAVPVNTSWSEYSSSLSASTASLNADGEKTQTLLAERGFGIYGVPLNLTLLCNEGNSFIRNAANEIAASLKEYNVNITVQLLSAENLKKAVQAGEYDLYIAEMKIPSNMNLSQFFSYGGSASYGIISDNITCDEVYFSYRSGDVTLDDFITAFNADMPFIPLVYRNGRFLYTRDVISELYCPENFFFSGMDKLIFTGR